MTSINILIKFLACRVA